MSVHPDTNWHFRDGLVSNGVMRPLRQLVDIVVFSGGPEWLGPRCELIYEFLDQNPDVPTLLIGIGSAAPLNDMRDVEKRVLSRENTLVITRSRELALQIIHILGFHKSSWLPCPAVLSSEAMHPMSKTAKIAAILQIPYGPQSIPEGHFSEIRNALDTCSADIDIIAFHEVECEFLASTFPDRTLRYSEKSNEYTSWFGQYGAVVSTRLHGALAAMSTGVWSCIFHRDDFRVNSTADLVSPVPILEPISAIDRALMATRRSEANRLEISSFKQETIRRYRDKLDPFMASCFRMPPDLR
ncbi:polysaccharide pyruvyl transferase family protein [Rhizobium sp. PL01]|nr:polysaccharide pyruvyl transferase family protein [Rhizobium sp. PL01]MDW5315987.1 polysaccharide pyruvyl transferase family protein [Rhizobium sp. PL01]